MSPCAVIGLQQFNSLSNLNVLNNISHGSVFLLGWNVAGHSDKFTHWARLFTCFTASMKWPIPVQYQLNSKGKHTNTFVYTDIHSGSSTSLLPKRNKYVKCRLSNIVRRRSVINSSLGIGSSFKTQFLFQTLSYTHISQSVKHKTNMSPVSSF